MLNWYAPSLSSSREASVRDWSDAEIVELLKTGWKEAASTSPHRAATMGPMGEVVYDSLQHVADDELRAMAQYLRSLPDTGPPAEARLASLLGRPTDATLNNGRRIYADRCAHAMETMAKAARLPGRPSPWIAPRRCLPPSIQSGSLSSADIRRALGEIRARLGCPRFTRH